MRVKESCHGLMANESGLGCKGKPFGLEMKLCG